MFEEGDVVVCVENKSMDTQLTIGKNYVILKVINGGSFNKQYDMIQIMTDIHIKNTIFASRFISQVEYRKEKIFKIKERICLMKMIN